MNDTAKAPEASFLTIVYTMATQAMIALGEIPNPMTKQSAVDERQSRWHLRSLQVLKEKTAGNLSEQESEALNKTLSELEAIFASRIGS